MKELTDAADIVDWSILDLHYATRRMIFHSDYDYESNNQEVSSTV